MQGEPEPWTLHTLSAVCIILLVLLAAAVAWIIILRVRTKKSIRKAHAEMEQAMAAERRKQQVQRMEAIGRLAGGVAHSFNNHLTSILGFSELLLEMILPKESCRDPIDAIHRAATRGSEFTQQLFALNRKQSLQMELLNLNSLLNGMDQSLRSLVGGKIELSMELDGGLGQAMLDRSHTEMLITSLVTSAREALPNGGQVTIKTKNVDFDRPFLSDFFELKSGSYVELTIRDNGCGMDEDTRGHIFEPYFLPKQKTKGGGLALALAYSTIKQSSGEVSVASEQGKGTTFSAYFPRVQ